MPMVNDKIKKKNFLQKFTVFDLIIIALVAALGIATKPVIVPLVHMVTGPLFIPGGAIAGGLYMMWIVVGVGIVGKRGTSSLVALVQAIMVLALGVFGTHGIMSIVTYFLPGIAVELFLILSRQKAQNLISCFFAGLIANITGTVLTNFVFFRLPLIPLVLTIASAALSGGLGGLLAYSIVRGVKKIKITKFNPPER